MTCVCQRFEGDFLLTLSDWFHILCTKVNVPSMISSLTLCNSRNTSSKISWRNNFKMVMLKHNKTTATTTTQAAVFNITCFILSRSNESVSILPPPGRALKKRKHFFFTGKAQFFQQQAARPAVLTLSPSTCLPSSLGPMAFWHHLVDTVGSAEW